MQNTNEYDHLFKIILIGRFKYILGDSGVGKTNIVNQYLNGQFQDQSTSTIRIEFASKIVQVSDKTIKAQIWDTAGQERFNSVQSTLYKGAIGAMIIYDITNKQSFDNIEKWLNIIFDNSNHALVIQLIGNKSDLGHARQISSEQAAQYAKKLKIPYIETSAKDGTKIKAAFQQMLEEIYRLVKEKQEDDQTRNLLPTIQQLNKKNKKNCC